ncbi:transcriptional regulator opi1 [Saxophila tyrrhenica]|uniref:Transcriptional regulator opi1 n=1 Tax=Saxophila tyrrhenica TaxID=1690608 RepID=A0AAV9P505_9PEZI|nr:transcriptional regulator opi1 [Saxophila tyrrhenica]
MEQQQQHRPQSYVSHNPAELTFPSVPKTDVNHAHATAEITLPGLKTVLSSDFHNDSLPSGFRSSNGGHESPRSVRSIPRIDPGPQDINGGRRSFEAAIASPSEVGSAMSIDEPSVRSPSVSIDDPNVRMAAEALSGLGNPESKQSSIATSSKEQEPLFQMFAKAHPWVGGTINGSLSAYSTTKNYSPRFVQSGVKIIESRIAMPVVSTVGTVGKVTGVESGIRWYYGGVARRPSDVERDADDPRSKRRRVTDENMDDAEQLPAYGASKPPSYRSEVSPMGSERQAQSDRSGQSQSLSSQVFVMTSALGVALSEASRRSLRTCLLFLAGQTERITMALNALKLVLGHYDQTREAWHQNQDGVLEKGERPKTPDGDEAARRLADMIQQHCDDIWRTLQHVVSSVSNYAGGALPENARTFIRTQLMSLPQRWRVASETQTGESETSRKAHRMVAFATEGLDMMTQVSETIGLTLDSAEQWLATVGRRRDTSTRSPNGHDSKDREMANAPPVRDVEKQ